MKAKYAKRIADAEVRWFICPLCNHQVDADQMRGRKEFQTHLKDKHTDEEAEKKELRGD